MFEITSCRHPGHPQLLGQLLRGHTLGCLAEDVDDRGQGVIAQPLGNRRAAGAAQSVEGPVHVLLGSLEVTATRYGSTTSRRSL